LIKCASNFFGEIFFLYIPLRSYKTPKNKTDENLHLSRVSPIEKRIKNQLFAVNQEFYF
jgi:hypothetical protein